MDLRIDYLRDNLRSKSYKELNRIIRKFSKAREGTVRNIIFVEAQAVLHGRESVKPENHISRYRFMAGEDKGFRGKRPSKKTCAELLEKDDINPGILSAEQRQMLEAKAGDKYKKMNPYEKRPDETLEMYARRLKKLVANA